jgi:hypothetical protein
MPLLGIITRDAAKPRSTRKRANNRQKEREGGDVHIDPNTTQEVLLLQSVTFFPLSRRKKEK